LEMAAVNAGMQNLALMMQRCGRAAKADVNVCPNFEVVPAGAVDSLLPWSTVKKTMASHPAQHQCVPKSLALAARATDAHRRQNCEVNE